jgi:hypothetical protein
MSTHASTGGLKLTDDFAEDAGGEKPGSEGAGAVLADGRQLSQGGSDRRRHMVKLPANLLVDRCRPVRAG